MATNPQFPERGPRLVDDHAKLTTVKHRNTWWPLAIVAAAAAILIALIVWLPRAPKAVVPPNSAAVPVQPTGKQIQLTGLKISSPTVGGAMNLTGNVVNTGPTALTGATVQASFRNNAGQVVQTTNVEMTGFNNDGQTYDFTQNPVKAGETRAFELRFERVPAGWNHSLPELRIAQVRGEGTK